MDQEEFEWIQNTLQFFGIEEKTQERIYDYYDKIQQVQSLKNSVTKQVLSEDLADYVQLHYLRTTISKLSFINEDEIHSIILICWLAKIELYTF